MAAKLGGIQLTFKNQVFEKITIIQDYLYLAFPHAKYGYCLLWQNRANELPSIISSMTQLLAINKVSAENFWIETF